MRLITYVKDYGGITAGQSQYYTDDQADRLIRNGIGHDATNGDKEYIEGEPTDRDLFLKQVDAFSSEVGALYSFPTIAEVEPRLRRLQETYKQLAALGEWPHRQYDLMSINKQGARLVRLKTQAEDRETQIERWLPGGVLRQQKEMKLNADMQRAQAMMASPSENERQRGEALRVGVEQKYKEMEMLVENLKAQRKAITG